MSDQPHVIFGREYPVQYDAIVIGAGIGGLICANLLAKDGMKVLLLERHYMLGGFCSTFRRKGLSSTPPRTFIRCWATPLRSPARSWWNWVVKRSGFAWIRLDQFHLPGMPVFTVPDQFATYVGRLKEWFPAEAANIDAYFAELRQAYMYGLLYYFRGVANEPFAKLEHYSMGERIDMFFQDPRLKIILMAMRRTGAHALEDILRLRCDAAALYFLGNYYPKGSSQNSPTTWGAASHGAAAIY